MLNIPGIYAIVFYLAKLFHMPKYPDIYNVLSVLIKKNYKLLCMPQQEIGHLYRLKCFS